MLMEKRINKEPKKNLKTILIKPLRNENIPTFTSSFRKNIKHLITSTLEGN